MNFNRRTAGLSLIALAAQPARAVQMVCPGGDTGDEPDGWWPRGTPVQSLADEILANRVRRLYPAIRNATREQHDAHLRSIFPQVIEQNFVRLDPRGFTRYLRLASDGELRALATLYLADVSARSTNGRLLPVLAVRASETELLRLSAAFGTMAIYDAVARYAPAKLAGFESGIAGRRVPAPASNQGFDPNVDMTILRIYQGFRSAPIGASSIPASLYQTAAFAGSHLGRALGAGLFIGSGISYLLTTYAPSVNEAIGGTLSVILEKLSGLTGIPISQAQEELTYDFQVTDYAALFEQTGGDFGAVEEWSTAAGYGGAGC